MNLDSLSGSNGISATSLTQAEQTSRRAALLRATTPAIAVAAEAERRIAAFNALPTVPTSPYIDVQLYLEMLATQSRRFRELPTNSAWFRVAARVDGHERLSLADLLYICNNLPDLLRRLELHVPHIFAAIRAIVNDSRSGRRDEHGLMVIGMRVASFEIRYFLIF